MSGMTIAGRTGKRKGPEGYRSGPSVVVPSGNRLKRPAGTGSLLSGQREIGLNDILVRRDLTGIGKGRSGVCRTAGIVKRGAVVGLGFPADADAHIIENALSAPVRYEQPAMGFAIPIDCLSREAPRQNSSRAVTLFDVKAEDVRENYDEPLRSILAIATLRLLDGRTDIDGAAQMAGISVRTLQRVLNRDGLNYRRLVELVRLSRAQALLRDTNLTITEVALTLGYSEHANFTRAFSRWTGQSPLHFRQRTL